MSNNQQRFSIRDQPCVKVVVFTDRAEVQRLIKAKLKKGENEIVINSISSAIDRDSVRVEGKGNASVLDVVCQDKRVEADNLDNISQKEKELKIELQELEAKREITNYKLERVKRQINVFNEFANSLSKAPSGEASKEARSVASIKENVDSFLTFLETFGDKSDSLDVERFRLEKELTKLDEQIRVTRDNLFKLTASSFNQTIEITILVESDKDDSDVELYVSYVLYQAQWQPKYDIRVFSKDRSMIINYFGVITQTTGEDWNDTKLSLSTAVPSIGGNVPELNTQNVAIKQPPIIYPKYKGGFGSYQNNIKMAPKMSLNSALYDECDNSVETFRAAAPMRMQTTNVETSNIGSTSTFDIPRNSTIPSDNNTHKVTIGIINLKPEFEYETVPKKNLFAYIKAKVINTSEYSLLAGPANVFLDNNFVSKTDLKSFSPQEEFSCSLGIDPAIRITYKPTQKFKSQSGGMLTKTMTSTTYIQVIEVKNTTSNTAKILLSENLPLSNDDKITVKLIDPNLKVATNARINKSNNLEFDLVLGANKSEEIVIKYSIDHPADKEIEFL